MQNLRWVRSDDRSVSPVVGGILVLAIVVMLAAVMLFMVNGLGDDTDPTPQAQLEFAPAAEGSDYELQHLGGDELGDGDGRVVVEGVANESILESRSLTASESVNLTPLKETVRIVFHSDTGESYVLASFDADPLPVSPDKGCEWVEDQTSDGSDDIEIDGIVVNCDVVTDGDVIVKNDGAVIGEVDGKEVTLDGKGYDDVNADGAVIMKPESTVHGSVDAGGKLEVKDESTVDGSVDADGEVLVKTDSTVKGDVEADGKVNVNDGATVEGSVDATGNVKVKPVSTVEGDVDTDGELKIKDESTVGGSVDAGEKVTLGVESTVNSDVETDAQVELRKDSTVEGSVDAGKKVTLKDGSTVEGTVDAGGDVELKPGSTIDGDLVGDDVKLTDATIDSDVYVGGSFDCSSSTIDGEDCDDYEPEDADDYSLVPRKPPASVVDRGAA